MADQKEVMGMVHEASDAVRGLGSEELGALIILSALLTEFKLAEVIGAEAKKVKAATYHVTNSYGKAKMEDLKDINKSVADVLEEVCCIEKQVNKKIYQGRQLINGVAPMQDEAEE